MLIWFDSTRERNTVHTVKVTWLTHWRKLPRKDGKTRGRLLRVLPGELKVKVRLFSVATHILKHGSEKQANLFSVSSVRGIYPTVTYLHGRGF